MGGIPLPSICLAVSSCLSNAIFSPFLDWLISSFPEKKYQGKNHTKMKEERNSTKESNQTIQEHMHIYTQKTDRNQTVTVLLLHISNYLTGRLKVFSPIMSKMGQ